MLGAVLLSGFWKSSVRFTLMGSELELQNVVRDALLIAIALISLKVTPSTAREGNDFSWGPIIEVAKLFVGIFLTIIPVIAILRAGPEGALAPVVGLVTGEGGAPANAMYFWLTGVLSSFLDNAPTYLVFFNLAGGDAQALMGPLAATLMAISAGAVYMGAMTYIGNAPNFMVKAIAEQSGIAMPSFFGYMAWSGAVLLPRVRPRHRALFPADFASARLTADASVVSDPRRTCGTARRARRSRQPVCPPG